MKKSILGTLLFTTYFVALLVVPSHSYAGTSVTNSGTISSGAKQTSVTSQGSQTVTTYTNPDGSTATRLSSGGGSDSTSGGSSGPADPCSAQLLGFSVCLLFPSKNTKPPVVWSTPYCDVGITWDYWQYDNSTPRNYRFARAGDAACRPTWGPEYCDAGITWNYWQRDNSTPPNYRYVRPGDAACQRPVTTPIVIPPITTPPPLVSRARLQFCPSSETVAVGESKPVRVYYWRPRTTTPTCAQVLNELSRTSGNPRVTDVTSQSSLSADSSRIPTTVPTSNNNSPSNTPPTRSIVSITSAGLVTGVQAGSNADRVRARYSTTTGTFSASMPVWVVSGVVTPGDLPPEVIISANPPFIRSGNSTTVSIQITAAYPMRCVVSGIADPFTGAISSQSFDHSGTPDFAEYEFTTAPLTSAQSVRATCTVMDPVANPFPATTATTMIEVIPVAEEV